MKSSARYNCISNNAFILYNRWPKLEGLKATTVLLVGMGFINYPLEKYQESTHSVEACTIFTVAFKSASIHNSMIQSSKLYCY